MTEPRQNDPVDHDRTDEDREISDVGLPGPGDDARTEDGDPSADDAALDEVFPAEDGRS